MEVRRPRHDEIMNILADYDQRYLQESGKQNETKDWHDY